MHKTAKWDLSYGSRPQIESLRELHAGKYCGVVAASDWTNGQGRHTTKKATPLFSERIEGCTPADLKHQIETKLRGIVRAAALRLLRDRPRLRCVVAITDLRNARKALRMGAVKRADDHAAALEGALDLLLVEIQNHRVRGGPMSGLLKKAMRTFIRGTKGIEV